MQAPRHHSPATLLLALCLALSTLFATPQMAQAEIIDRIVARVNDEIITFYDLRISATPYMLQRGLSPDLLEKDNARSQKIYSEVLGELIDGKLLLEEAKKLNLNVTDEEVERWLAFTQQQQKMTRQQFEALVAQYGMKFSEYKQYVRENLIRLRFIQLKVGSKVSVSDAEVEAEYRQRFGSPPRPETFITVSHILFQPASNQPADIAAANKNAQAALQKLNKGADFGKLAAKVSNGPSKSNKGYLGSFKRGELDPDFEDVAFKLKPGEISKIVKTKHGFHIIRVAERRQKIPTEIREQKETITLQLRQRATQRQLKSYLNTLRSRAFVDVKI